MLWLLIVPLYLNMDDGPDVRVYVTVELESRSLHPRSFTV